MPSLCVVVVLVEIVRSGRLGKSFATLGSRKLFCTVKSCHDLEQRRLLVEATTLPFKRPRKRSTRNKGKMT